ncbi:cysteine hydrolase family protein [Nesterenkonia populi]|uniref:cysteine hydrolase family protein n=1 Tax=Nesterenkonia populi TaxID=1591087 RepID=UPI002482C46D|nr:cysteine hydrolase [Nesterenkonia populi]
MIPCEDTCLIVVDMQGAFLDASLGALSGGPSVGPLRKALPGTQTLVEHARDAGIPVIFTRYVYSPGLVDFGAIRTERARKRYEARALSPEDPGVDIVPELAPRQGEVVIDKSRPSAFYGTRLEPVLTGLGIRNLVICGVTTNICVESTARDAGQRDYGTFVARDAVAEFTQDRNDHSLFAIEWFFGKVLSVKEIVNCWEA